MGWSNIFHISILLKDYNFFIFIVCNTPKFLKLFYMLRLDGHDLSFWYFSLIHCAINTIASSLVFVIKGRCDKGFNLSLKLTSISSRTSIIRPSVIQIFNYPTSNPLSLLLFRLLYDLSCTNLFITLQKSRIIKVLLNISISCSRSHPPAQD